MSKYSSLQLFDLSDDLDDKTAGDWEHLHLDETFHGTFLSPSSYQQCLPSVDRLMPAERKHHHISLCKSCLPCECRLLVRLPFADFLPVAEIQQSSFHDASSRDCRITGGICHGTTTARLQRLGPSVMRSAMHNPPECTNRLHPPSRSSNRRRHLRIVLLPVWLPHTTQGCWIYAMLGCV